MRPPSLGRFGLREPADLRTKGTTNFTLLLATLMLTAVLLSNAHASRAATSYDINPVDPGVAAVCASLGGAWDGSSTCTLESDLTIDSGYSMVVDSGAVLVIPMGVTVTNNGSIDDYGAITNYAGGFIANSGTIAGFIGNGSMTNHGSISNDPSGSISVEHSKQSSVYSGSFDFTNAGVLDNRGVFVSFGNFTNTVEASITNSGSFIFESATINVGNFSAPLATNAGSLTNFAAGTVIDDGATVNNTGIVTNAGTIAEKENVYSVIYNFGTITSNGTITDQAYFGNNATITNSGTITTLVGCPVAACGTFSNNDVLVNTSGGTIDNQGNFGNNANATLTNDGTLANSRLLVNNQNATILNSGAFNSSGIVTNIGSITNSGSIVNTGTIMNSGGITNGQGASVTNSRIITNAGSIVNSGSITDTCGGVLYGPGTVSGEPVNSTVVCTTTTSVPEFPTGTIALVLLAALVLTSLATRKRLGHTA
jgi:hypothetical protein